MAADRPADGWMDGWMDGWREGGWEGEAQGLLFVLPLGAEKGENIAKGNSAGGLRHKQRASKGPTVATGTYLRCCADLVSPLQMCVQRADWEAFLYKGFGQQF